jgi:hypothetical protein
MAKTPKSSIKVVFTSPVESITDKALVKAAYKDLCKQITTLAEAIAVDPNVLISHSIVDTGSVVTSEIPVATVDAKIAELQTTSARISSGKSPAVTPGYKSKFEPSVVDVEEVPDPEETPHIKVGHWVPPTTNTPKPVIPVSSAVSAPTVDAAGIKTTIFSKLRKSSNSLAIIDFLVANANKEVSIEEIATGAKLEKSAVNGWLAQTGKEVKAITKGEKRGHYIFDSSKVKVY